MIVDTEASMRFLRTAYEPDDWIALFLKSYETGQTLQRVGPLSLFLQPKAHAWLRAMNAQRFNIYVGVNAIRPGVRARTKDAIGAVRHVFLEADHDGPQLLAMLASRSDLPPASYALESSPNRVHVFWRAAGFAPHRVEWLQKHLAREFGTDPAATSCSQTTRLPGYRNHKHILRTSWPSSTAEPEIRYAPPDFPTPPEPLTASVRPPSAATYLGSLDVIDRYAGISRASNRPSPADMGTCTRFASAVGLCVALRSVTKKPPCPERVECALRATLDWR